MASEGGASCGLCNGTGNCVRLIGLLDSAERIMLSSIRNGETNEAAFSRWQEEKLKLCTRYPKSLREMCRAP